MSAIPAPRPLVACPHCGRIHPGHHQGQPHYCSIGCYRAGTGLDDPVTGDGRTWCEVCGRYVDADHEHPEDASRLTSPTATVGA
ncbi:MAG TPA: hypothetical protein VFH70_09940 [Acidimicrobiales bacterium]|nr:hypothetical protein [Acidimicrobiales bacterium]